MGMKVWLTFCVVLGILAGSFAARSASAKPPRRKPSKASSRSMTASATPLKQFWLCTPYTPDGISISYVATSREVQMACDKVVCAGSTGGLGCNFTFIFRVWRNGVLIDSFCNPQSLLCGAGETAYIRSMGPYGGDGANWYAEYDVYEGTCSDIGGLVAWAGVNFN